jgi:hypothetical protein
MNSENTQKESKRMQRDSPRILLYTKRRETEHFSVRQWPNKKFFRSFVSVLDGVEEAKKSFHTPVPLI